MTEAIVETLWDRDGERSAYQTRVKCGAFRIHIFWRGDRDPDMHDHPADFWTFPLVSYVEEFRDHQGVKTRIVRAFRLHRRKAEFAHRVLGAVAEGERQYRDYQVFGGFRRSNKPIVTLGWWGKPRREWGFWTHAGFVPWKAYVSHPRWNLRPPPPPLPSKTTRPQMGRKDTSMVEVLEEYRIITDEEAEQAREQLKAGHAAARTFAEGRCHAAALCQEVRARIDNIRAQIAKAAPPEGHEHDA